ncbi:MAG: VanZ family protein [Gemmatimonadetes bacterium]|nr:VanZ family protein [Gemmatimonadota bacterium]
MSSTPPTTRYKLSKLHSRVEKLMTTTPWRISRFVWLLLIFIGSSGLLSFGNTEKFFFFSERIHHAARKFAHIAEYAILTYLCFRSLWTKNRFTSCVFWSVLISILYAILDEYHQSFVPSRTGVWTDVVWDGIGVAIIILLLWYAKHRENGKIRQWIL